MSTKTVPRAKIQLALHAAFDSGQKLILRAVWKNKSILYYFFQRRSQVPKNLRFCHKAVWVSLVKVISF